MAPCGENVLGCVQDGHIEIQSNSLYINKDYKFVRKRWKDLYDVGDAVMLQDAVKSHLYNSNYENGKELDMSDIDPEFNPLDFCNHFLLIILLITSITLYLF